MHPLESSAYLASSGAHLESSNKTTLKKRGRERNMNIIASSTRHGSLDIWRLKTHSANNLSIVSRAELFKEFWVTQWSGACTQANESATFAPLCQLKNQKMIGRASELKHLSICPLCRREEKEEEEFRRAIITPEYLWENSRELFFPKWIMKGPGSARNNH